MRDDSLSYPVTDIDYVVRLCNEMKRSFAEAWAQLLREQTERFLSSEADDPY